MNALLAVLFAAGVGLIWAGAVCHAELPPLRRHVDSAVAFVPVPVPFFVLVTGCAGVAAGAFAWLLVDVPALTVIAALIGGYVPFVWVRHERSRRTRERERAWPAAISQLADALVAGLAFPAAVALTGQAGPAALRAEFTAFHARIRNHGLQTALDGLSQAGERTADTVVLFLRAGLIELPTGGLAPLLRDVARVLSDRLEAREKARTRAASLQLEAAVLALSPIVLLLLIGTASPGYLAAYRTTTGTLVATVGGLLIFGCYLLMRHLGRIPEPRRTTNPGEEA